MSIKDGDRVSVHYTGRLESGEVFDSSEGRDPLTFTVGSGELIPGFDRGVIGKTVGDKTEVTCAPEEAYGPRDETRIMQLERERLQNIEPEVGQYLGLEDDQGNPHQASVTEVTDTHVTLDFNHFLAGKTLIFTIEVVSVEA